MIKIDERDFATLAICAIRYCHGRQTYMPDLVRSAILPHLNELSDETLGVMIEDCEFQNRYHLYGDEKIDKPNWIKWHTVLLVERERRINDEQQGQRNRRMKMTIEEAIEILKRDYWFEDSELEEAKRIAIEIMEERK